MLRTVCVPSLSPASHSFSDKESLDWLCPLQCCVCPTVGGALKPTNLRGLWCHAACLQWIPEVLGSGAWGGGGMGAGGWRCAASG